MNSFGALGRGLVAAGALLFFIGVILIAIGKISGIVHLPGDIIVRRKNFIVFIPLATSLLISALVSLLLWLMHRR